MNKKIGIIFISTSIFFYTNLYPCFDLDEEINYLSQQEESLQENLLAAIIFLIIVYNTK